LYRPLPYSTAYYFQSQNSRKNFRANLQPTCVDLPRLEFEITFGYTNICTGGGFEMMCEKCGKNSATVHLTQQQMNGQKREMHMCQACAFKMTNLDSPQIQAMLGSIMKSVMEQMPGALMQAGIPMPQAAGKQPEVTCPQCGLALSGFTHGGKFGCEGCYSAFAKEVRALVKTVQAATRHEGKFPRRMGATIRTRHRTDELKEALQAAISQENYEEAARLRDEIRGLSEVTQ
jgi:protein arginine kinase activator